VHVPIPEPSHKKLEFVTTAKPVAEDGFHLKFPFTFNQFRCWRRLDFAIRLVSLE
jgi:hypothetical protein